MRQSMREVVGIVVCLIVLASVTQSTLLTHAAEEIATPTITPIPATVIATPYTSWDTSLVAGWNLISMPDTGFIASSASNLAEWITSQGMTVTHISRWRNGAWESYLPGFSANNFTLDPRYGVFVKVQTAGTWRRQ